MLRPMTDPIQTQAAFDAAERAMWQGRTEAYAGSFARLCAHPVEALLDAAGVRAGTRVLDVERRPVRRPWRRGRAGPG